MSSGSMDSFLPEGMGIIIPNTYTISNFNYSWSGNASEKNNENKREVADGSIPPSTTAKQFVSTGLTFVAASGTAGSVLLENAPSNKNLVFHNKYGFKIVGPNNYGSTNQKYIGSFKSINRGVNTFGLATTGISLLYDGYVWRTAETPEEQSEAKKGFYTNVILSGISYVNPLTGLSATTLYLTANDPTNKAILESKRFDRAFNRNNPLWSYERMDAYGDWEDAERTKRYSKLTFQQQVELSRTYFVAP